MDALIDSLTVITLDHAAVLLEPAAIVYAVVPTPVAGAAAPIEIVESRPVDRGQWRGVRRGSG
jgi:hypothetical protein